MVVTWVGHATVLVQTHGLNILTDPVWSDRTGPFGRGPQRVAAPGVRFEDLPQIDLVLVSHNHYDHLDKPTLKRLWAARPAADRHQPGQRQRASAQTGARGDRARLEAARAAMRARRRRSRVTRAHHWGSRWFTDRNRALWSGFVVTLPSGGNLFFAGDTGFGDGSGRAKAAALGPIRLRDPADRRVPLRARADGDRAAISGRSRRSRSFDRLGAAHALPVHWGTFRLSYEGYDTPPKMLAALMRCTGADPAALRGARHRGAVRGAGRERSSARAGSVAGSTLCAKSEAVRALP